MKKIPESSRIEIEKLKSEGIPIKRVQFHDAVKSNLKLEKDNVPEFALYAEHTKSTRRANLWYTEIGLLVEQPGGYKLIPLANVKDTDVL